MSLTSRLLLSAALGALLVPTAQAQTGDPVDGVLACRSIADVEQRLACFDQTSTTLAAAREQGEIVVVTRESVQAVERDSFGFNLPSLPQITMPSFGNRRDRPHDALAGVEPDDSTAPAATPAPTVMADAGAATPEPAPAARPTSDVLPDPEDAEELAQEEVRVTARDDDGNVDTVTMRIERTRTVGYNTTIFYMTNGQVWRQIDDGEVRIWGNGPHYAEIRRGAMTSYLLRINGQGRAIRVARRE
jgi:hypothetical protein